MARSKRSHPTLGWITGRCTPTLRISRPLLKCLTLSPSFGVSRETIRGLREDGYSRHPITGNSSRTAENYNDYLTMRDNFYFRSFMRSLSKDQQKEYRDMSINQQKDWYISFLENHYQVKEEEILNKPKNNEPIQNNN